MKHQTQEMQTYKDNWDILHRWSVFIVAAGLSALNSGKVNDIAWLVWLGVAVVLGGIFMWAYRHYYNLGIAVAILGGTLFLLGASQHASLFGAPITEAQQIPLMLQGGFLIVSGMIAWAYLRFVSKSKTAA